jgi:hypothetical protein
VLPNPNHTPTELSQFSIYEQITLFVRGQFPTPERAIVFWLGRVPGTAMPETAIHEDCRAQLEEDEIRAHGKSVEFGFEQYATGTVTLDVLRHFFAENKVKTRNGKMVGRAFVSNMLSSPFYYGHFRYGGEVHEGKHKAIISKKLFDDAHAILKGRYKWSPFVQPVKPKPYLGLLHCSTCGGAITAEIQKGHTYYRCTKKKAKGMSQKKSLEEQSAALSAGRANWLEPFQNWIIAARNAGEIAVEGSPQEKKVLAQQMFGSNLVLDCKKARGSCVKPWSLLVETSQTGGVVEGVRKIVCGS